MPANHFLSKKMKLFSKKWKARKALILAALRHFLKPKNHFFKKKQKKLKKSVDIWGGLPYNMSCVGQRSKNK